MTSSAADPGRVGGSAERVTSPDTAVGSAGDAPTTAPATSAVSATAARTTTTTASAAALTGITPSAHAHRRFNLVLTSSIWTLAAISIVLLLAPQLQLVLVAPGLDLVINTAAALAAAALAILAWARYAETDEIGHLFKAGGFLVLAVVGTLSVAVSALGDSSVFGLSLTVPGQQPLYVWTLARVEAAAMLILGAFTAGARGWSRARSAIVLAGPTLLFLAGLGAIYSAGPRLAPFLADEAIRQLSTMPAVPSTLPGVTPLGLAAQLGPGLLFIWAALLYRRLYLKGRSVSAGYLSIGLVFAAFSQIHFALYPGVYTSLITTGDILRLMTYGILILGIQAETRADMRALRRANAELAQLRDSEAARAALEERARLAREMHDGLSQDLWFAKLKAARLASLPDLSIEARVLTEEIQSAVEAGLFDARQAVWTMRAEADGVLRALLDRYVNDFSERAGIKTEVEGADAIPVLPPRTQTELGRILQEALSNVMKHADATVVRISAKVEGGDLLLTVTDNGRGFDQAAGAAGYGLRSMTERAAAIGGRLSVRSHPLDGTSVLVQLPLPATAAP